MNPLFLQQNPVAQAKISSFSVSGQVGETSFSGQNINLEVDWDVDISKLIAEFTLSEGASAYMNGIEQESGVTENDFSNPIEYTIKSADQTVSSVYTVYVSVKNDIPTNIYLNNNSIEENSGSSFIGNFTVETENPDENHVLSLVNASDAENSFFYISGNQLRANNSFNYEEKSSYRIKVRADDEKGGIVEKYFTIAISDVNDAPTNISLINRYSSLTIFLQIR